MSTYNDKYTYNTLLLGTDDFVQTSPDLGVELNGTTAFSVDAWIKLSGLGNQTSILKKEGVFDLSIDENSVVLNIDGCMEVRTDESNGAITQNEDHHICITYNGSQVRIYIDGIFNTFAAISGGGSSNSNPFVIGNYLEGEIRGVRIFKQALDSDTVMYNMYNEPDAGTVATTFDFTQNPPIAKSLNNLPLELNGNAKIVKKSPALYLPSTAYAHPLQDNDVNPGGFQTDPYTIQSWVYVSSKLQQKQAIFVNSDLEKDTGVALFLSYDSVANGFRVNSQRGSDNFNENTLVSNSVIELNKWTNIATCFDGVNLSIYINSVLDTKKQFPPITLVEQSSNLIIGATLVQGQPVGAQGLEGYLSRVEVWDKALNTEELANYMNQTPEVPIENLKASYNFMVSPPRNTISGHPVGLADFAVLSEHIEDAPLNTVSDKIYVSQDKDYGITPEMLQSFRDSVSFEDYFNLGENSLFNKVSEEEIEAYMPNVESLSIDKIQKALHDYENTLRNDPQKFKFAVTHHLIDKHYVVVCHNAKESYVAGKVDASTVTECEFLYIKLVFVAIAGILDALFSVKANLTTKAQAYIKTILKSAKIQAIVSVKKFTAVTVFALGAALFTSGFLKELIMLVATIGFWAILKIIAKAVLTFMGVGSAAIIASLVATGVYMGIIIVQIVDKCGKKPPAISLASIQFNQLNNTDALSIRVNYNKNVELPEWKCSRNEQYPAAYSSSRAIISKPKIEVRFTINTTKTTTVNIKATGGGILGAINEKTVIFHNGTATALFSLDNIQLSEIVATDIQWNWQYQLDGNGWLSMRVSKHKIYCTLQDPTNGPWKQVYDVSNTNLPWSEVLDFACEWARGKNTIDEVATAITRQVNEGLGLRYDTQRGGTVYTKPDGARSVFLCEDFLDFLKNHRGKGLIVNCTDCATIVTTFANALGCNLIEAIMSKVSVNGELTGFACNKIKAIGDNDWDYPFSQHFGGNTGYFRYHEIAWKDATGVDDYVYDACLKLDNSDDPWSKPDSSRIALLPTNIKFSTRGYPGTIPVATPFKEQSYRERLAQNKGDGIPQCEPLGSWAEATGGREVI